MGCRGLALSPENRGGSWAVGVCCEWADPVADIASTPEGGFSARIFIFRFSLIKNLSFEFSITSLNKSKIYHNLI